MSDNEKIVVGKLGGPHGVRGWIKVLSHTDPRENIFAYNPWWLNVQGEWKAFEVENAREQGKGLVVKLADIDYRDQAQTLLHCQIAVNENQLPELDEGEYYWRDLIGLEVFNQDELSFGKVERLLETGANDVLIVKGDRERLVPYIDQVVLKVDLDAKRIDVDWDADF